MSYNLDDWYGYTTSYVLTLVKLNNFDDVVIERDQPIMLLQLVDGVNFPASLFENITRSSSLFCSARGTLLVRLLNPLDYIALPFGARC